MSATTTILVSKKLKSELDSFKEYPRETYGDVLRKMVHIIRESDESELELNKETLKEIEEGREDFRKGRFYTTEQLKKKLGL